MAFQINKEDIESLIHFFIQVHLIQQRQVHGQ